jgi:hypothetical protein
LRRRCWRVSLFAGVNALQRVKSSPVEVDLLHEYSKLCPYEETAAWDLDYGALGEDRSDLLELFLELGELMF